MACFYWYFYFQMLCFLTYLRILKKDSFIIFGVIFIFLETFLVSISGVLSNIDIIRDKCLQPLALHFCNATLCRESIPCQACITTCMFVAAAKGSKIPVKETEDPWLVAHWADITDVPELLHFNSHDIHA